MTTPCRCRCRCRWSFARAGRPRHPALAIQGRASAAPRASRIYGRATLACTGSFVTRPPEAGGVGVTGPGRRGEARQVAQSRWALNEAARPFTSLLCSVILNSGRYRRVCSAISYCPRMSSACPSSLSRALCLWLTGSSARSRTGTVRQLSELVRASRTYPSLRIL
jgi:hypothetical protein